MPNLVVLIFQPRKPEETLVEIFENIESAYDPETMKLRDGVLLLSDHSALIDAAECHRVLIEACGMILGYDRSYIAIPVFSAESVSQWAVVGASLQETKSKLKTFLGRDAGLWNTDHE